jgi:hypothetical protein
MLVISGLLAVLVAGSLTYCALIIWASRSYLKARSSARTGDTPPISVLKPLCGHDQGLEDNLRSFFEQDYPVFELLAGVHRADDPAVAVFEQIRSEYPEHTEARLIVTGESPVPNAKAFSLKRLVRESRYDLLVMGDSDIRVKPDVLKRLAGEFTNPDVGLVTCPYRAVSGPSLWSHLEAIGMNTEFLGGVLVARMIEGMKFALGCVVAVRRNVLDAMGGFQYLQDYLAQELEPSPALGPQHSPLPAGGLLGADFYLSLTLCLAVVGGKRCRLARSFADDVAAGGRRLDNVQPRAWQSAHLQAMAASAASGPAGLSGLDGRLPGRHRSLARPQMHHHARWTPGNESARKASGIRAFGILDF